MYNRLLAYLLYTLLGTVNLIMRKVIWERWLTKVIIEEDSSIIVDTPISIERGFKTEQDAIDYAFSWGGSVDRR